MNIDEAFKRNTAISDCMGLVHSQKRRRKSARNGEKGRRSGFFQFSWHKCWFLNNDEVFKSNTESSDHKGVVHVKKRRQKSAKMVKKGAGRFLKIFLTQMLIYASSDYKGMVH